jgi:predicted RNase H-like nuclease (RuvC/YqgF family)
LERWINDRYETIEERLAYNLPFDSQRLLVRNYIATLCLMHRSDLIEAAGGFDESLASHEDWDLWIRFSRKVDFVHVDAVTAAFTRREVPDSYSTGDSAAFLESLKTVRERYAHLITDPAARLDLQQARRVWNLRSAARGIPSLTDENKTVPQTASDALAVIQEKDRTIFHLESETRRKTRHVELLAADRIEKNVHIETLAKDLDRLRRQRNNLEAERLENVGKIEALSAHAANLEADRTVKTRHIENLESMRAEQERYAKSLEREIPHLKTYISQLESQLERTYASLSWRITKPLRYMKKLLRGTTGK